MSDQVTQEATSAPDDIRASLRAAVEQHAPDEAPQSRPADRGADTEEASPSSKSAPQPAEDAQDAAGRARDAQGRFARTEGQAAPEASQAPAQAAPEDPAKPDAEFNKATAMWSSSEREILAKAPPDVREFVLKRERERDADYTKKTQALAEQRREYEPIQQLLEPHREQMRQRGLTPAQLIQTWYSVERGLMDPNVAPSVVANIIRGYNIDQGRLVEMLGLKHGAAPQDGAPAPQQGAAIPPALAQQLHGIQSWIHSQETQSRQREQVAYQEQATRVQTEIDQFASATDSAGALLHPYFRDVEADMERLAQTEWASGRKPSLSNLYETAIWMNPSIRERMVAAQSAAQEAQRAAEQERAAKEARARAQNARRAASPVTGSPGPVRRGGASGDSLRSVLQSALEQHTAA